MSALARAAARAGGEALRMAARPVGARGIATAGTAGPKIIYTLTYVGAPNPCST